MPNAKRIIADLRLYARGDIRAKTYVYNTLLAPVFMMLAFGAIFSFFSGSGSGPVNVYLQNRDSGQISTRFIDALNSTGTLRVILVSTSENLTQYLSAQSAPDGVVIPVDFSSNYEAAEPVNVTVYGNPSSSSSAIVGATVSGVINAFNLGRYGGSPIISMSQTTFNPEVHKYIDFLVPGLFGMCILLGPMQTLLLTSSEYKKAKLFKQLSLTPITKTEWLVSKAIWYTFMTALSFPLMVAVGIILFGAHILLTVWLIPFLILGPILFTSFGMLAGTLPKDPGAASGVFMITVLPMLLLSGVFYPLASMPLCLQYAAHVLPLTYVIEGLNAVMIYNNYTLAAIDIAVLAMITLIFFVAAARLFNWRED